MIPKECKRLAEVDFPIATVSKHAAREKEARCGHIPKLHIWPAARPTGSSRAILLALLVPDPCDPLCPEDFKAKAREALAPVPGRVGTTDVDLREALLRFIGDIANWDHAANPTFLAAGRGLVKAAHLEETPLVVDPFAGGGSIPLEALRLGCDAFASDLNAVACLILKTVVEDVPRHGPDLADKLRRAGAEIKAAAEKELAPFYPPDPDGARPIAYLWARTVRCEAPNCGAEIPLVRSFWLVKKAGKRMALRYTVERPKNGLPRMVFEFFAPKADSDVPRGTVSRAKATCSCCGTTLAPDRVRVQLREQRGGADVVFNEVGDRISGAMMLAVVTLRPGLQGREYRLPTDRDYAAVSMAQARIAEIIGEWEGGGRQGACPVPDEPLPLMSGTFNVPIYGMDSWGDLFTARQKVALKTFAHQFACKAGTESIRGIMALAFSKMVDMNNNLSSWQPHAEIPAHMLTRFAIPMKWDFSEAVPIAESSGSLKSSLTRSLQSLPNLQSVKFQGQAVAADATSTPMPDEACAIWFTDPPYYFAIPYADLSDFFFVWLKRAMPGYPLLQDIFNSDNPLTHKERELCEMKHWDPVRYSHKDKSYFEEGMKDAFAEGRRVLKEDGIGCVVFAHKTTEGWEALLSGMIQGGWTVTGSWPIATEMASRLRARESAALATSVHLVCRPRPDNAPIGDWAEVLRELPSRVSDWIERLQSEGVRGADLVFACIGPALEIFSRYSKVETAEGREVKLPEYLEKVWEVVGRIALEQILGTAEARARNGLAGALEEDARLTALFLWTLQSTEAANGGDDAEEGETTDEEDEGPVTRGKPKGFSLIFDVVRRFAQPLGIHLDDWNGRIIETKKGVVRLLPVAERAKQLFGESGAGALADEIEYSPAAAAQMSLFPEQAPAIRGRGRRRAGVVGSPTGSFETSTEATTLDRVHAAMLLQSSGRSQALRNLLKAEQERGPDFLRLANALTALYPRGSEEKRLLDAMLLAVPR